MGPRELSNGTGIRPVMVATRRVSHHPSGPWGRSRGDWTLQRYRWATTATPNCCGSTRALALFHDSNRQPTAREAGEQASALKQPSTQLPIG